MSGTSAVVLLGSVKIRVKYVLFEPFNYSITKVLKTQLCTFRLIEVQITSNNGK